MVEELNMESHMGTEPEDGGVTPTGKQGISIEIEDYTEEELADLKHAGINLMGEIKEEEKKGHKEFEH